MTLSKLGDRDGCGAVQDKTLIAEPGCSNINLDVTNLEITRSPEKVSSCDKIISLLKCFVV